MKLYLNKITIGIVVVLLVAAGYFAKTKLFAQPTITYQTANAQKSSISQTVSASGQTIVGGRIAVLTQASGTVKTIYVKTGDTVAKGDKLVTLELDQDGTLRSAQAYSGYLSAKNNLASAQANMYSTQSTMFNKWKIYMDLAQSGQYQNSDNTPRTDMRQLPQFYIALDDWQAAQAQYINQQGIVNQAQAALNSAWISYQNVQPDIIAPTSGTIQDLTIVPGIVMTSQSAATGNSLVSQKIASIKTGGLPVVQVSLAEIDVPNVKAGQKATVTFDALPDKTFAGSVFGINTTGTVSSGVTTYPATIQLDSGEDQILPNMSASAIIITQVKNDVLTVPSGAVQTNNSTSYVLVLKNGLPQDVTVTTGITGDTNTEITSGLNEGDQVVTQTITSGTTGSAGTSAFSSQFRLGGGGGAAALRPGGFGGGNQRRD